MTLPPLPRVLILDYHDSYTNNLLVLFAQIYPDEEVRSKVVVIQADSMSWLECQSVLEQVDCVILSPGPGRPDNPADIGFALELIRTTSIPLLGICLGLQALGVAYGGKIVNADQIRHGQVIQVEHNHQGIFDLLPEEISKVDVVVYNSLVVETASLPEELELIAYSPLTQLGTSSKTVQGLQHRTKPQWGVQFHPESISSTSGLKILQSFLNKVWLHHSSPLSFPNLSPNILPPTSLDNLAKLNTSHVSSSIEKRNRRRLTLVERDLGMRDFAPQKMFQERFRAASHPLGEVWLDGESPNIQTTASLALPKFILAYNITTRAVTCHYLPTTATSNLRSPPTTRPLSDSAELEARSSFSTATLALASNTTFWEWFSVGQQTLRQSLHPGSADDVVASMGGVWAGYWGYEMKAESLGAYPLPAELASDAHDADACWAWCDEVLEREITGNWIARGVLREESDTPRVPTASGDDMLSWLDRLGIDIGVTLDQWEDWTKHFQHSASADVESSSLALPKFLPLVKSTEYQQGIQRCRDAIFAGNSYELTLTTTFEAKIPPAAGLNEADKTLDLYLQLRRNNPAPYSAYFSLPSLNIYIMSSSPERFIRISSEGQVEMKPIKGTRKRVKCTCDTGSCGGPAREDCKTRCEEEDRRVGEALQADLKERAENLMIVDLIRSDLLSCCTPSSVQVPKLIKLETYATVHQLVTTVVGQLERGVGEVDAVRRCFPPGSMTGAPKLRSVQILDELEGHRRRGVYSGALGYMSIDGAIDLSVVIRTIVVKDEDMSIGAGGAITWLSEAGMEWEEVLTKVASVTRA